MGATPFGTTIMIIFWICYVIFCLAFGIDSLMKVDTKLINTKPKLVGVFFLNVIFAPIIFPAVLIIKILQYRFLWILI